MGKLLRESPSLKPMLDQLLPEVYEEARQNAADETGLAEAMFPADCPFTIDEVSAADFLPEP